MFLIMTSFQRNASSSTISNSSGNQNLGWYEEIHQSQDETKTGYWRPHECHQQAFVLIVVDVGMVLLKRQRARKERSDVEGAKYRGEVDEVRIEYNVEV